MSEVSVILVSVCPVRPGWVDLRFRYAPAVIAAVKQIPGCRWVKERRSWTAPTHALPALEVVLANLAKLTKGPALYQPKVVQPHPAFLSNPPLRPYQQEGVKRLLEHRNYLLAFDMRTGKTRTAAAAAATLLAAGDVRTIALMYPNVAKHEWLRQFKEQTGLEVVPFEGTKPLSANEFESLAAMQHLCIGIHYELIRDRGDDDKGRDREFLELLERRGDFVVVADEVHYLKNRKAGRTKFALSLSRSPRCVARYALTGTPMRNYPRDMWAMFDFMQPDSMGSYSKFTTRYAGGHMGDYGWEDKGTTHHEELAARLSACSFRVTRRDVAQWLPMSDRRVVLCNMSPTELQRYRKQEAVLGVQALDAMREGSSAQSLNALKQLVALTTGSKIGTMLDRVYEHAENRRVKVLVFANFHETLSAAWDAFEAETPFAPEPKATPRFSVPGFIAGGWMSGDRRRKAIEQWKACPGPAVLFANTLSSGVGIDLSDADTAIFLELAWVPADFLQAEARIQDVHLGKRVTPPLYEYLLVRQTVDEDMGLKLIEKLRAIEKVVGSDVEARGVQGVLSDSGLVDRNVLSLKNEDPETVEAALDSLRARLFGDETPDDDRLGEQSDNEDRDDADADADADDEDDDEADE